MLPGSVHAPQGHHRHHGALQAVTGNTGNGSTPDAEIMH